MLEAVVVVARLEEVQLLVVLVELLVDDEVEVVVAWLMYLTTW